MDMDLVLQQIENLPEDHFMSFFKTGQVSFPTRGTPELNAVIQADQHHLGGDRCIGVEPSVST
jgi:hypothetical protein